jgi:hypothetical protein
VNGVSQGMQEYIYWVHPIPQPTPLAALLLLSSFSPLTTDIKTMSNATDSPRKENPDLNDCKHAAPIPILASRRSSSASSDGSPTTPPDLQTSASLPSNPVSSSPTSSPIFSYFMSTSPKTSASVPYRRLPGFGAPPVFEGMCHLGYCYRFV